MYFWQIRKIVPILRKNIKEVEHHITNNEYELSKNYSYIHIFRFDKDVTTIDIILSADYQLKMVKLSSNGKSIELHRYRIPVIYRYWFESFCNRWRRIERKKKELEYETERKKKLKQIIEPLLNH